MSPSLKSNSINVCHDSASIISSMASIATATCNYNHEGQKETKNESSKKLIQIIDESTNNNNDDDDYYSSTNDLIRDDHNDDDNDGPPPLFTECQSIVIKNNATTTNTTCTANTKHSENDEPSLMEQMMKDALKAKKEKAIKLNEKGRKDAKKMNFGLKKGFLYSNNNNNTRSKAKAKNQQKKEQNCKGKDNVTDNSNNQVPDIIYELDKSGNMVPIEEIPIIKPKQSQTNNTTTNPLQFQEVQDAMHKDSTMFNHLSNNQHEWNTPDLINQISNNQILSSGLTNPKFVSALEAFKCNPKEAMKRFHHHPDVIEFLTEFCKIMGNHFTVLGEKQEEEKKKKTQQQDDNSNNTLIGEERDLGPMAKEALKKEAERKEKGEKGWNKTLTYDERKQLDSIMQDKELTSLLMDVDMQRVMNECSTQPGRMRMYMHDKDYAPKLHKLIKAGLLKVV